MRWWLSFKKTTWKLIIKNTKWPPRADWAAMNPELIFKTSCLIFSFNIRLLHHQILIQLYKVSLRCKVSSINDNVCQKTSPLNEVNQAVLSPLKAVNQAVFSLLYIATVWSIRPPPPCLRCTCSEVLCLGIVTFEQGVAWPTGSYSMAVRPFQEHPCELTGNGNLTMWTVHMFYNSDKLGKQIPRCMLNRLIA